MNVVLVHGAYTWGGRSRLFNLTGPLADAGYLQTKFVYGFVTALTCFMQNPRAAKKLARAQYDIVIGYSNGALVADKAANGDHLICLSPALDSDHVFSSRWKTIHVFWNPGDNMSVAEHIPWHPWGAMMREGIRGRALQDFEENICIPEFIGTNKDYEHGDYFEDNTFILRFAAWMRRKFPIGNL